MKNKLVFRILGALASALIIISVFVPFVSITGYSQSLWQSYEPINALYLPIMIIVFGVIGVIVFAIDIKTELAYTSTGALLFFLLTQTIPIVQTGTFGTLGVGYYFLVVGTILTGIMAFLCNLRVKPKISSPQNIQTSKEVSVIDQINKLYDNQTPITNIQDNVIGPVSPQSTMDNNVNPIPVAPVVEPLPISNNNMNVQTSIPEITPMENTGMVQNNNPVPAMTSMENVNMEPIPAPIPEFNTPVTTNNIVESNPVISEFSQPVLSQNVSNNTQTQSDPEISFQPESINPVVSEFSNSSSQMVSQSIVPQEQSAVQPLNNLNQSNNNSSNLDIFG